MKMTAKLVFGLTCTLLALGLNSCSNDEPEAKYKDRVNVMEYISNINSTDLSDDIQKCIANNRNRVIYFPDGVYKIAKPIVVPAANDMSVCLELSNYAVIQASSNWSSEEAMIRMGGSHPSSENFKLGSNYYLKGGYIDGNKVAKGVSIESGRETVVSDINIKNTTVGIHIKSGSNNGSSDADIHDVNIVGFHGQNVTGIIVDGWDNTFSNIRMSFVHKGMVINSAGNHMRNVHPLYCLENSSDSRFDTSIGFEDNGSNNWYDFCYVDNFAIGFQNVGKHYVYDNCFIYWYSNYGKQHIAFNVIGQFNSIVTNFTMGLYQSTAAPKNYVLVESGWAGAGDGVFENLYIEQPQYLTNKDYETYLK